MPIDHALTGPDLLSRLDELRELPFTDKVRACGYFSTRKDGRERLNIAAFHRECARAHGAPIEPQRSDGRRKLPFRTRVMPNGQVTIGARYVEMLRLEPGDEVQLRVKRGKLEVVRATDPEPSEAVPFEGRGQVFPAGVA